MKHDESMDPIRKRDLKKIRGPYNTIADKIQAMDDEVARVSSETDNITNEQLPYSYNIKDGLMLWRAKKAHAKQEDALVVVNMIGDSIFENYGASNASHGVVNLVRVQLQIDSADVGEGYTPLWTTEAGKVITYGGTWETNYTYGIYGINKYTNTALSTMEFDFDGTGIDIVYAEATYGATMSVSIDGGTTTTFNTYNASPSVAKIHKITGLSDGSHTIVITKSDDTKQFYFIGYTPIKGVNGIRVDNLGKGGMYAKEALKKDNSIEAMFLYDPDLTVIGFLANDSNGNSTLAEYTENIQAIITRAKLTGDVLLVSFGMRTEVVSAVTKTFADEMKRLALLNNCAYLDMFNRWGADADFAKYTLELLNDTVHPNDSGHQEGATAILDVVRY